MRAHPALLLAAALPPGTAPAASLLGGEGVADSWPLEPLTTAPDPHGYHKGLTGFSLGNHRLEVAVDAAAAALPAVVARAEWRRRPKYGGVPPSGGSAGAVHRLPRPEEEVDVSKMRVVGLVESAINGAAPAHTLTNITVLNATADAALIAFMPEVGAATYTFYYMPYVYQGGDGAYRVTYAPAGDAATECPLSAPTPTPTDWRANNGTARSSLVSAVSPAAQPGQYWATNAPWKTADGNFNFSTRTPPELCTAGGRDVCQGYDGVSGPEVIIYDFGECVKVDGFALWAVGDGRHDPHSMTLAVGNTPTTPGLWCAL